MTAFVLKNLLKIHGGRNILDLPHLSIEKGRIWGLMGPNGSGKTTLFSILAFLEAPSHGQVFYEGRKIIYTERFLHGLRREVILVHQHPILFSTTVHHNVAYGLKIRNIGKKEREKIVDEVLDRVGMRSFAKARGPLLSGGETQRVAIARALACRPRVLLLDEPTASVDAENQAAIEAIIRDLHADTGLTILIATHNRFQASRLIHEEIHLFRGRVADHAADNFFTGTAITRDGRFFCRTGGGVLFPLPAPAAGRITVSIDPAGIRLTPIPGTPGSIAGRVLQLTLERDHVRILVDAGVSLHATVPGRDDAVRVGDRVHVELPEGSVRIVGPQFSDIPDLTERSTPTEPKATGS